MDFPPFAQWISRRRVKGFLNSQQAPPRPPPTKPLILPKMDEEKATRAVQEILPRNVELNGDEKEGDTKREVFNKKRSVGSLVGTSHPLLQSRPTHFFE